jgi:hypothetical protein
MMDLHQLNHEKVVETMSLYDGIQLLVLSYEILNIQQNIKIREFQKIRDDRDEAVDDEENIQHLNLKKQINTDQLKIQINNQNQKKKYLMLITGLIKTELRQ